MHTRLLIAVAATMFAVLMTAIAVATGIFVRRFDAIEAAQAHEKAQQVARALEADLNQLAISTRDYAEWDEAEQYVLGRNHAFIDSLSYESLNGMEVDIAAVFAADGSVMYSAELDLGTRGVIEPAPAELLEPLRAVMADHRHLRQLNSTRRIVNSTRGPMAFCGIEVRRSDKSSPTGAVMFFARMLEGDEIERVRQTSGLPVELILLGEAAARLPPQVAAWAGAAAPASATYTVRNDDDHITSYAMLRDTAGRPLGMFATRNKRDIAVLGRVTTHALMGTIAGLLLIFGLSTLILLLRLRHSWAARAMLENRHHNILLHLDETIVLADRSTGRIVDANQALLSALDYDRRDLDYLKLLNVYIDLPDELRAPSSRSDAELIECRMRARDGRLIDAEITLTPVIEEGRELICIVGRDVSLRKQAEAHLRESESRLAHIAEHDELTGLPNRRSLQRRLPALLQEAARRGQSLFLLHVDIDHFKNVNDSRDHAFGDRALQVIAQRLDELRGDRDTLIRMGGDEFVMVCAQEADAAVIRAQAQRVLDALVEPLAVDADTMLLTASIGIAVYPQDGLDAESLLKHADIALYDAKEHGRNTYRLFASDMNVQRSEHVALEQALRRALNSGQIYVEYQPLVDLQTGLLVSFEALARWKHPELGQVPPARFIPVAEKSGLIAQLGEQVIRTVVAQLSQWQQAGVPLAPVAVNVAPVQFELTSFCTLVQELTVQYEIGPKWLAFEVTESAWLQNSGKHIDMIDALRHAGSRIYIDDFGTGFSNLSNLKTLPVDAIKIDQAFVRAIATDEGDAAIVGGIISMADKLHLRTIAEGIETAEQADRLRALGCHYGQGYYFSKPIPASHCRALLEQLGDTRRFTETVKIRAFRAAKSA